MLAVIYSIVCYYLDCASCTPESPDASASAALRGTREATDMLAVVDCAPCRQPRAAAHKSRIREFEFILWRGNDHTSRLQLSFEKIRYNTNCKIQYNTNCKHFYGASSCVSPTRQRRPRAAAHKSCAALAGASGRRRPSAVCACTCECVRVRVHVCACARVFVYVYVYVGACGRP